MAYFRYFHVPSASAVRWQRGVTDYPLATNHHHSETKIVSTKRRICAESEGRTQARGIAGGLLP